MKPVALTDEQLATVSSAAASLHPRDRGAFLQTVADLLNGHEIGDGAVARAAREAQARFRDPPQL